MAHQDYNNRDYDVEAVLDCLMPQLGLPDKNRSDVLEALRRIRRSRWAQGHNLGDYRAYDQNVDRNLYTGRGILPGWALQYYDEQLAKDAQASA